MSPHRVLRPQTTSATPIHQRRVRTLEGQISMLDAETPTLERRSTATMELTDSAS